MNDGLQAQENGTAVVSKVLKSDGFEALSRARMGIDAANAQAQTIIAQAHEQAEQIRIVARQESQQETAALLAEYTARMHADMVQTRSRLVEIIANCLRRIIDPIPSATVVASTVQRAIADADIGRGAILIVAPKLVSPLKEQFGLRGIAPDMLDVRGDPECPLESTILRTDFGDIELGIEMQLRAIERGLVAARDQVQG